MRELSLVLVAVWFLASCGGDRERGTPPVGEVPDTAPVAQVPRPDTTGPPDTTPAPVTVTVSPVPPASRPTGDTTVTGVVRSVGAMPLTQTVVQSPTGDVALVGPLRNELEGVLGAEVRVWGKPVANTPPAPPRAVEVSAYEVVQFNGQRPIIGRLVEREDTHFIEVSRTDIVRLAALPRELTTLVGRRVWVFGDRGPNGLRVQVFGEARSPSQ